MVEQHLLDSARRLSDRLVQLQAPIRVLDAINWDRSLTLKIEKLMTRHYSFENNIHSNTTLVRKQ
ncbi:MAG: hypothetical protein M1473_11935 [Firmicutes bacterium]|nr:hypothetical protein [Bacillota bacterium]